MRTLLIAGALLGTVLLGGSVGAGEPNAEVAKAIQDIAARRVAKEEARVRQIETWAKGAGTERGWAGGVSSPAPGQPLHIELK